MARGSAGRVQRRGYPGVGRRTSKALVGAIHPAHESVGATCLSLRFDIETIDADGRRAEEVLLFGLGVGGDAPHHDGSVVTEPVRQGTDARFKAVVVWTAVGVQ